MGACQPPAHRVLASMDEPGPDHFEMRGLESLSNTIFGVAMTLLAYDLPRSAQFSAAPTWSELSHLYAARLIALTLSFLIAGLFWFSHHRRLMRQPYGSRPVVFIKSVLPAFDYPVAGNQRSRWKLRAEQRDRSALRVTLEHNRRAQCLAMVERDPRPAFPS